MVSPFLFFLSHELLLPVEVTDVMRSQIHVTYAEWGALQDNPNIWTDCLEVVDRNETGSESRAAEGNRVRRRRRDQYSSGRRNVVQLRSASVISQMRVPSLSL